MSAQPGMDGRYQPTSPPSSYTASDSASLGGLLKELAHEVSAMLGNEVALAKSEARESMRTTTAGVAAVASGGAVALSGFIVLLMAAVYGLATVMALWLSALIVGAVVLLVGYAMVQAGRKKFSSDALRPDRTLHSLRQSKDALRGRPQ